MSDTLGPYRLNEIYTGDCRELMVQLPAESVDFVLTSPPYDNLRLYNGYEFDFPGIADQIARVIKPGGVMVWVVGDGSDESGESGSSFEQALYFKSLGLRLHDTMIYMKAGPSYPSQDKYYQVFEYMFVFSKGRPAIFNPLKDRENRWYGEKWSKIRSRRNQAGVLKTSEWSQDEGGKLGVRFNIWQYAVGYGYQGDDYCHQHPASFPEALAEDHILSWTNPGDTVLDPMCGSGTTCKMAFQAKRHYLGFDISEKYTSLARERLRNTQPSLFVLQPAQASSFTEHTP